MNAWSLCWYSLARCQRGSGREQIVSCQALCSASYGHSCHCDVHSCPKGWNKQLKQNCAHPWWQPLHKTKAKGKRHAALFRGSQQVFGESLGGIRATGGNGLSVLCAFHTQSQTKQRRLTSGAIVWCIQQIENQTIPHNANVACEDGLIIRPLPLQLLFSTPHSWCQHLSGTATVAAIVIDTVVNVSCFVCQVRDSEISCQYEHQKMPIEVGGITN